MVSLCDLVVPLLHRYLSDAASSSAISEQALRCFSSWAQFGLPLPDSEPVIALVFTALCSEPHFDVAVDALVSIFSHPDNHRLPTLCLNIANIFTSWAIHSSIMLSVSRLIFLYYAEIVYNIYYLSSPSYKSTAVLLSQSFAVLYSNS